MSQMIRKSDFKDFPNLVIPAIRLAAVNDAINSAHQLFHGQNPLTRFRTKSKDIYQIKDLPTLLVVRKLRRNIQQVVELRQQGRKFIITNLTHLVSEGVPYRLYRLDVEAFYESFDSGAVVRKLEALPKLSPLSKKLLRSLFDSYIASGGKGIPRGIALSATLSELMMKEFDDALKTHEGVHFFARYVDDILIITGGAENEREFLDKLKRMLPAKLSLNETKKRICTAPRFDRPAKKACAILSFDYLGYQFSVSNPAKASRTTKQQFRDVAIDIASSKLAKIKTRIVRSFLSFNANHDYPLLALRIKYLTSTLTETRTNSLESTTTTHRSLRTPQRGCPS